MPDYPIDADNAGRRLDAYVRQLLPEVPLGAIMKWLRTGRVRVNGKRQKPNVRLALADIVSVPVAPEEVARGGPRLPPPVVVYEDDDLLVVNKPAGLAAHAGSGHELDSLDARVNAYLGAVGAPPGRRPGLVQRLDRWVSGLVPAGKHARAIRALNEQDLDKVYIALVHGRVGRDSFTIDLPLTVDAGDDASSARTRADAEGKTAVTHVTRVRQGRSVTLLEVRLETGRTHQIRAHLAAVGHPIVGDTRYGEERDALPRPFLHAATLRLRHPMTGEPLELSAPLPQDLLDALSSLME